MKKIFLLLYLIIWLCPIYGQIDYQSIINSVFSGISSTKITTGILIERAPALTYIDRYTISNNYKDTCNASKWVNVYQQLYFAHLNQQQFQYNNAIIKNYPCSATNNTIPLGVILYDYNRINPNAISDGLLVVDSINNKIIDVSGYGRTPLDKTTCFVASLLTDKVSVGTYSVYFDPNLFKSNKVSSLSELYVDFNDTRGFVRIFQGGTVTTTFGSPGIKDIKIKAVYNNTTYICYATIDVHPSYIVQYSDNTPIPGYGPTIFDSDGIKAEYGIWYRCYSDGSIRKPYVIVSGFDPQDKNRIVTNNDEEISLYSVANKNGYLDELRENGYDIVIYRSTQSTESIIPNAMNLVQFIQKINREKTSGNELIIAGASMGGLVVRYALTYMEYSGMDHQTKLFISIDSPQSGANVPLGFQLMITWLHDDLYKYVSVGALKPFVEMLYNNAAKEMLIYHAINIQGEKAYCAPERTNFINTLSSMGDFPRKCRSIAVSMGSGTATTQGFTVGKSLLKKNPSLFLGEILTPGTNLRWEFEVWALPDHSSQKVYTEALKLKVCAPILVPCFPWESWECALTGHEMRTVCTEISIASRTFTVDNTLPLDNAPGSKQGFHNLSVAAMNSTIRELALFLSAVETDPNYDCFIPSYSALGLNVSPHTNIKSYLNGRSDVTKIDNNLYQNFNKTSLSPFDFLYIEEGNDFHIYHPDTKEGEFSASMLEAMSNISYPQNLLLENRIIDAGEVISQEVPEKIVAGYSTDDIQTNNGDYIIANGGNLELNATQVILKPGFHAQAGSNVKIGTVVFWTCPSGSISSQTPVVRHTVKVTEPVQDNITTPHISETKQIEQENIITEEPKLFPNPVIDKLYIFADGVSNILKIFNMKGQLLKTLTFSESVEIDMSDIAAGMYLFQVIQSDGTITNKRIIKQ